MANLISRPAAAALAVTGLLAALPLASRLRRRQPVRGEVAIVCGASRGLGRAIARELVRRGADVAICARTARDLESVRRELELLGAESGGRVLAEVCDLRLKEDVDAFVAKVDRELGAPSILVANAATITVGPIESLTASDFDDALASTFKTALHPALAVLPRMQARRRGTLCFITSIGGKIGVPHLAPYSSAKFAAVGFAEALRAEVAKDGLRVLTVIPGLMRTGSHLHGLFKGNAELEYSWFGASATAPLVAIDADRAARRVVSAIALGREEIVYTVPARLGRRMHGWAPSIVRSALGLAGRLLPPPPPVPYAEEQESTGTEGRWVELASTSPVVGAIRKRSESLAAKHAAKNAVRTVPVE
jgi:NAD(P)-dependent dehydrogenase (short-subunit alcohol dehydrogenase family)